MGRDTAIAWTDHTFNPWWGCEHVSPGCDSCYAEAFAKRTGHDVWGHGGERRTFGERHWAEPRRWTGRVFCASMCDVFEPHPAVEGQRRRLWALVEDTPALTWQLLTKRPEQIGRLVPGSWAADWPTPVWIGTTVEDQARARLRIPRLLAAGGGDTVRFLSVEPMLEAVDLSPWLAEGRWWVICGGESGPRRRLFDPAWARAVRDQCAEAGAAFFFKQAGGLRPGTAGPDDLEACKAFPSP